MRAAAAAWWAWFPLALSAATDAPDLFRAVRDDDRAAVQQLLRQGANPNAREPDGTTPLGWAAVRTNGEIAGLLLKAGADANLTNELGLGPLALAVANGPLALVEQLLAAGADPNVARENGETPLMTAARLGRVDVLERLLAKGAAVNARDQKFGQTALM